MVVLLKQKDDSGLPEITGTSRIKDNKRRGIAATFWKAKLISYLQAFVTGLPLRITRWMHLAGHLMQNGVDALYIEGSPS